MCCLRARQFLSAVAQTLERHSSDKQILSVQVQEAVSQQLKQLQMSWAGQQIVH